MSLFSDLFLMLLLTLLFLHEYTYLYVFFYIKALPNFVYNNINNITMKQILLLLGIIFFGCNVNAQCWSKLEAGSGHTLGI